MKGMTIIVKTISSWVKMLIFIFGIYIILFGHLTPGGGFAGGVIIALSYVHLTLAYGKNFVLERVDKFAMSSLEAIAAILFVLTGIIGLYVIGNFLANFMGIGKLYTLISAGYIPMLNIFICVKVGMGLYLVFYYLASFKPQEG